MSSLTEKVVSFLRDTTLRTLLIAAMFSLYICAFGAILSVSYLMIVTWGISHALVVGMAFVISAVIFVMGAALGANIVEEYFTERFQLEV